METDPPSLENSDQVGVTSDDQDPSPVRSYECSFCKRGFSNAQALGGHMNIHRRDRAKLKEPSNIRQSSSNITKKSPLYLPVASMDPKSLELESSEEMGCTLGWPWILPREDGVASREETHMRELRQLPLFVEMPSGSEDWKPDSCGKPDERKMQSTDGSARVELDLELRLGPEPEDTCTTGTKQFF